MAQHDQVIDDGQGSVVRADINAAFAAIFSSSSGAAEPLVLVPGQLWFDLSTTPPALRCRNQNNDGWIDVVFGDTTDFAPAPIIDSNPPANGSYGQIWIDPATGKMFVWMGGTDGWVPVGGGGGTVDTSDEPPTDPDDSQFWFDSASGALYLYYRDVDGAQWVQVSASPATGGGGGIAEAPQDGTPYARQDAGWVGVRPKTARPGNRVTNPNGIISQQNGATAQTANWSYPADMWMLGLSGVVVSGQQQPSFGPTAENTNSAISIVATTAKPALAAGDYAFLANTIEGYDIADFNWRQAGAQPAVLRFTAMSIEGGTFPFFITNADYAASFCGKYTLAANEVKTFSFPIPVPTSGVWARDYRAGIVIGFPLAVGSTNIGVEGWQASQKFAPPGCTNGAATTTNMLYVTEVGLYRDPDNIGAAPPWEMPRYDDQLRKCMRYWQTRGFHAQLYGLASNGNSVHVPFAVPMRQAPTIAFAGTTYVNASALAANSPAAEGFRAAYTTTAAGAGSVATTWQANARM